MCSDRALDEPRVIDDTFSKSRLHTWCNSRGLSLQCQTYVSEDGFKSTVTVDTIIYTGTGTGRSKKEAERRAFQDLLNHLTLSDQPNLTDRKNLPDQANLTDQKNLPDQTNLSDQRKSPDQACSSKQSEPTTSHAIISRGAHDILPGIRPPGTDKIKEMNRTFSDAKSYLCHWCRINKAQLNESYSSSGEPHTRLFLCNLSLVSDCQSELVSISATALTKKASNHLAAKKIVRYLLDKNLASPHEVRSLDLNFDSESESAVGEKPYLNENPTLPLQSDENQTKNVFCLMNIGFKPAEISKSKTLSCSAGSYSKNKTYCASEDSDYDILEVKTLSHDSSCDSRNIQNKGSSVVIKDLTHKIDSLSMNDEKHGYWNIDIAKSKLHQFLQENNITADYHYSTDCYDLEGYHKAFMRFNVEEVGRHFRASGQASTKAEASRKCAFSLVKQLYHADLIEAYTGTLKKEKPVAKYKNPIALDVPIDLVKSIENSFLKYGIEVPKLISNETDEPVLLSAPPPSISETEPSELLEGDSSDEDTFHPRFMTTKKSQWTSNWNPWTSKDIEKNEHNYNVSLREISVNLKSAHSAFLSQKNDKIEGLLLERQELPIYKSKEDILELIDDNPVSIIKGSTGCGKSTQVCQYVLDDMIEKSVGSRCNVVVVEPRRICATSIAERVAEERGEPVGRSVGYAVRHDACFPRAHGAILFCTTGTFLRKLQDGLTGISHIIVDEVHERNLETDYILIILRKMVKHYNLNLKVILMSASVDIDLFSSYFDNCPHYTVEGNCYPVKDYFLEDCIELIDFKLKEMPSQSKLQLETENCDSEREISEKTENLNKVVANSSSYSQKTLETMASIDEGSICFELIWAIIEFFKKTSVDGSILVFLPGWADINKAMKYCREQINCYNLLFMPLHSKIERSRQKQVFQPHDGKTKVIFATNIAESSVTVDDVVCVIDSCRTRISRSHNNLAYKFVTVWASKVNLEQRAGRAGRVRPGYCFRLCSKARYDSLPLNIEPEILRTPLYNVALSIKLLNLGHISEILNSAIQPPDPLAIQEAERLLIELKCLDESKELTDLGALLARLPLDPRLGRMILMSFLFGCSDQILSIAAYASTQEEIFTVYPTDNMKVVAGGRFSDHMAVLFTLSNTDELRTFTKVRNRFLNNSVLETVKAKKQLCSILESSGFCLEFDSDNDDDNDDYNNDDVVTALLCQGFYPNICAHNKKREVRFPDEKFGLISKSSLMCSTDKNFSPPSPIFVFGERTESDISICRNLTMVTPLHLLCFSNCKVVFEDGLVKIDDWLSLQLDPNVAAKLVSLRALIDKLLVEIAINPARLQRKSYGRLRLAVKRLCNMNLDESFYGNILYSGYRLNDDDESFGFQPRKSFNSWTSVDSKSNQNQRGRGYQHHYRNQQGGYQHHSRNQQGGYQHQDWNQRVGYQHQARNQLGGYQHQVRNQLGGYQHQVGNQRVGYQHQVRKQLGGYQHQNRNQLGRYQHQFRNQRGGFLNQSARSSQTDNPASASLYYPRRATFRPPLAASTNTLRSAPESSKNFNNGCLWLPES